MKDFPYRLKEASQAITINTGDSVTSRIRKRNTPWHNVLGTTAGLAVVSVLAWLLLSTPQKVQEFPATWASDWEVEAEAISIYTRPYTEQGITLSELDSLLESRETN